MSAVAVYNMKGGVGKTTTAVNLSYLAAAAGYRTLLWDLDPQAAGIQVLEGATIPVSIRATDDVQVRSLELLVNGQVVFEGSDMTAARPGRVLYGPGKR